jgi:hypothetical protein
MMHFAEILKEIGGLYYAGQDDLNALSQLERETGHGEAAERQRMENLKVSFLGRLENALQKTRAGRAELENAKLRLDDAEAFNPELEIFDRYIEILGKEITDNGGNPVGMIAGAGVNGSGGSTAGGSSGGNALPPDMELLQNRVSGLFREISLSFPAGERSVAALASFAVRDAETEAPLIAYLNESALVFLSGNPGLALVERSRLDAVRAEQRLAGAGILDTDSAITVGKLLGARYMITGQVIPMASQVIVFGRVIDVQTGEILSAAQVFLERRIVGDLL